MKTYLLLALIALAFVLAPALGSRSALANEDSDDFQGKSPQYQKAVKAIEVKDYRQAIALLKETVAKDGKDADAFNLLGLSYRKLQDFSAAFVHYRKALRLNPDHRGAHEYIGEAYLQKGNLAKAREHLEKLDDLCFFACDEYTDLKNAIKAYEARG